jgi:hypothetical protein
VSIDFLINALWILILALFCVRVLFIFISEIFNQYSHDSNRDYDVESGNFDRMVDRMKRAQGSVEKSLAFLNKSKNKEAVASSKKQRSEREESLASGEKSDKKQDKKSDKKTEKKEEKNEKKPIQSPRPEQRAEAKQRPALTAGEIESKKECYEKLAKALDTEKSKLGIAAVATQLFGKHHAALKSGKMSEQDFSQWVEFGVAVKIFLENLAEGKGEGVVLYLGRKHMLLSKEIKQAFVLRMMQYKRASSADQLSLCLSDGGPEIWKKFPLPSEDFLWNLWGGSSASKKIGPLTSLEVFDEACVQWCKIAEKKAKIKKITTAERDRALKLLGIPLNVGVSGDMTEKELKKIFHQLALKKHPDVSKNSTGEFTDLKTAYELLMDLEQVKKEIREILK